MNGMWFGDFHSFENLNLILSKVDLPPATVKTTYVDNPGGDGQWDLTEAHGKITYKNRDAKFTFSVLPGDDFETKKTEVSNLLNGRRFKIILDKDPEYYWDGRCSVNQYESNKKMRKIVVGASVAPYKYKRQETVVPVDLVGYMKSAKGEVVSMKDVSPFEHKMSVKVEGKNLLPFQYVDGGSGTVKEINGITWTVNADGTITANGTATAKSVFSLVRFTEFILPSGTYTISGCPSGGGYVAHRFEIFFGDKDGNAVVDDSDIGAGKTVNAPNGISNAYLVLSIASGATANNLVFKPMIEKGTTATAYAPYIPDISAVTLKKCGANLRTPFEAVTSRGYIVTKNIPVIPNTNYVYSGKNNSLIQQLYVHLVQTKKNVVQTKPTGDFAYTFNTGENTELFLQINLPNGCTADEGLELTDFANGATQLELGTIASPYEPYIEPITYPVNEDGTVEGVTSIYPTTTLMSDTAGVLIEAGCMIGEWKNVVLNNGRKEVVPTVTCTDDIFLKFNGHQVSLNAGTHKVLDLQLVEGDNTIEAFGMGNVTFTYREGDL